MADKHNPHNPHPYATYTLTFEVSGATLSALREEARKLERTPADYVRELLGKHFAERGYELAPPVLGPEAEILAHMREVPAAGIQLRILRATFAGLAQPTFYRYVARLSALGLLEDTRIGTARGVKLTEFGAGIAKSLPGND